LARRLIVDTTVLIASERDRGLPARVVQDDDAVIAAVTVAELQTGVELAEPGRREGREAFLAAVLAALPVEPYDLGTARSHGRLLADTHRAGTQRGAHDLIIAATAATTGRTILTADRKARFDDLPGVDCLHLPGSTG
jgi:tRNA(fMet)-specific endonuclease VapC